MFSEIDEAYSCTLAFEGKGTTIGMVIGTAQINLSDRENGTRLTYAIAACAGGKLAEHGENQVTTGAQRLIDNFLAAFSAHVAALPRHAAPANTAEASNARNPFLTWVLPALVVAALVGYYVLFK